jgi:hypothetical protein
MNTLKYRGHSVEVKPFVLDQEGLSVAFPFLYDCYVDGVRRHSGFLQTDDAELYGQALVDDEATQTPPA